METKHFLITLFNLKLWSKDKNNVETCTDAWLSERFNLFEKYCLPSVKQQTSQHFTWICLFDINTPLTYKKRIEAYKETCAQIAPLFIANETADDWYDILRSYILEHSTEKYIITTNLDNDDAIHKDMVQTIQNEVEHRQSNGLYTFINGMQFFPHKKLLLKMKYPHNHFLSYVDERGNDMKTIKELTHTKIRKQESNVFDIYNKPYWLEIVHNNNVSNDFRITSRIKYSLFWKSTNLNDFGIPLHLSGFHNIENNIIKFPIIFLHTAVKKIMRKI